MHWRVFIDWYNQLRTIEARFPKKIKDKWGSFCYYRTIYMFFFNRCSRFPLRSSLSLSLSFITSISTWIGHALVSLFAHVERWTNFVALPSDLRVFQNISWLLSWYCDFNVSEGELWGSYIGIDFQRLVRNDGQLDRKSNRKMHFFYKDNLRTTRGLFFWIIGSNVVPNFIPILTFFTF